MYAIRSYYGIKFSLGSSRVLLASAKNFPMEALFLRDDDIPQTVADGVADIGIVGENEVLEKKMNVVIAKRLGFSKCRLSLAIPKSDVITSYSIHYTKLYEIRKLRVVMQVSASHNLRLRNQHQLAPDQQMLILSL